MPRLLLAAAFVIAGIPFTGLVGTGIRFVFGDHPDDRLPNWYGWIFAFAALVVAALFAACAMAAAVRVPTWTLLFRAAAVALPVVALASLGSLPLIAGAVSLLLATWLLKRRDAASATRRMSPDSA